MFILNKKNFEDEKFPHELFLRTRQMTKIRNAFANNMSVDVKLNKAQISKIIQSCGSFGSWLDYSRKKSLTSIAILLARRRAVREGKGFTLLILYKI